MPWTHGRGTRWTAAAAAAAALLLAAGAACGGDDEVSAADPSSIEGGAWIVSSGLDVEGWEAVAPSATFEGGTVAGSTGCNRYRAPYTLDGGSLAIGQIASTMMACPPPGDAVEREYLAALGGVTAWQPEGDDLALLGDDDSELLRFRAATPVGSWEATGLLHGDAIQSLVGGTEITATFEADGTVSGSAGCNNYRATFTAERGDIDITEPGGTKKLCPVPDGIMEQEAAYLAALSTATRYRVDGRSLELLGGADTIVVSYTRAAP